MGDNGNNGNGTQPQQPNTQPKPQEGGNGNIQTED